MGEKQAPPVDISGWAHLVWTPERLKMVEAGMSSPEDHQQRPSALSWQDGEPRSSNPSYLYTAGESVKDWNTADFIGLSEAVGRPMSEADADTLVARLAVDSTPEVPNG